MDIHPAQDRQSKIQVIEDKLQAAELFAHDATVKLFFREHHLYACHAQNWGASKGQVHYQDVCVVLNSTSWKEYKVGNLSKLAPLSRNKLYVACTRARGNLYLMPEALLKGLKATR